MIAVIIICLLLWLIANEIGKGAWSITEDFEEGWKEGD